MAQIYPVSLTACPGLPPHRTCQVDSRWSKFFVVDQNLCATTGKTPTTTVKFVELISLSTSINTDIKSLRFKVRCSPSPRLCLSTSLHILWDSIEVMFCKFLVFVSSWLQSGYRNLRNYWKKKIVFQEREIWREEHVTTWEWRLNKQSKKDIRGFYTLIII